MADDIVTYDSDDEVEYNIIDVVNAVNDMGVTSIQVQTARNFLLVSEDYFDSDNYADFIELCGKLRDLYVAPYAASMYYKTPAQLTESERYAVFAAMSMEDRQAILDEHIYIIEDNDILMLQDYASNLSPVFYYSLYGESAVKREIRFITDIGTAPEPIAFGAELPVIPPTDGMVHTGWVNYFNAPVTSSADLGYSPTYKAVWEEAPPTVDYIITYQTEHGTAPTSKTVTVNEGESYALTDDDLPTLEADGYTFKGWTANGTAVSVGDTISANTTLTAVWDEVAVEPEIAIYQSNGSAWVKKDLHENVAKTYLYNDVTLPALPDYDKTLYPYVYIFPVSDSYYCHITADASHYVKYNTQYKNDWVYRPSVTTGIALTLLNASDTAWYVLNGSAEFEGFVASATPMWANHDILNENGTLFLEASEPIPVGGAEWQKKQVTEAYKQVGGEWVKIAPKSAPTNWLTFSSAEPFTIALETPKKDWDGTLYHSTDTIEWSEWDGITTISSAEHDGENKIYMRGSDNNRFNDFFNCFVLSGNEIRCQGNIESLLDYETVAKGEHPVMDVGCFAYLFSGNSNLITAPELPATSLTDSCYSGMFANCTGLTVLPKLPATVLLNSCYFRMFDGCTGIKLSTTQTGEYQTEFRIPISGTGTTETSALSHMFDDTGGTFTGTPEINTTYYTSNTVV